MIPLMAIAAGASLASAVFGGIKSAQARKKQRKLLEKRANRIENVFNREYYQDFLERDQSRSFLARMREKMKDANRIAESSAVVTGATQEAKIAQKSALQKNYADAVNHLAGMASQHKDSIRNWHENAQSGLYAQRQNMLNHTAKQWTNFMSNALGAASSFAGMSGAKIPSGATASTKGIASAVKSGGTVSPAQSNNAFKLAGF